MLEDAIWLSDMGVRCELKESVNCMFCVNVHDICVNCVISAFCSDCMTDTAEVACVFNSFVCGHHQCVCALFVCFLHDSYDVVSIHTNNVWCGWGKGWKHNINVWDEGCKLKVCECSHWIEMCRWSTLIRINQRANLLSIWWKTDGETHKQFTKTWKNKSQINSHFRITLSTRAWKISRKKAKV